MSTELRHPVELTDSELDYVSGGTGTTQAGLVNLNNVGNENQILNCNKVNVAVGVGSVIVQAA